MSKQSETITLIPIEKLIPKSYAPQKMEEVIFALLDKWDKSKTR